MQFLFEFTQNLYYYHSIHIISTKSVELESFPLSPDEIFIVSCRFIIVRIINLEILLFLSLLQSSSINQQGRFIRRTADAAATTKQRGREDVAATADNGSDTRFIKSFSCKQRFELFSHHPRSVFFS